MLEAELERKAVKLAAAYGALLIKWLPPPSHPGVPDRILLYGGRVAFIEFKTERGRVSRIQAHRHATFREVGIHVKVIRTLERFEQLLETLSAGDGHEAV